MKHRRKSKLLSSDNYYERHSHEVITKVLTQMVDQPYEQIRSAVRSSYPFGEKKGRPYKTWNRILLGYEAKLLIDNNA